MTSYYVEYMTFKQARTLSGTLFHKTSKSTLVSEKGDVELLTKAEEGFDHLLGNSRFVYTQTPRELTQPFAITWCCGLSGDDNRTLMLKCGEETVDDLDVKLVSNLEKLLNPACRSQSIRFEYNGGVWELVVLQNFRSTQYLLRRELVNPTGMANYFPVFEYEQVDKFPRFYSVIEQFKQQLVDFYTPE